ncbi:antitoxin of toxin-antitoxin stability system [Agrobacterium tumefaciens]|uniref:Antitoxin of toxin-antitoxin stability system n=1 Tax=Agrobacterium tumefaciens TaxID=358 RepID=A0AAJ4T8Y7_AGRTU|nr:antitoxin of toxin-antitoxin stability system [Agrobacterium tumefaciens]
MPQIIEKTVYAFNELSDRAKERARDWWRGCEASDFDPDCVLEDAQRVADLLGITLAQKPVKLMGGGTRYEPTIYYSGFSSQGDGACYEGSYRYQKGATKAIRGYAPEDKELHRIADELQRIQKGYFYGLTARMKHDGHYDHAYSMSVDVDHDRNPYCVDANLERELAEPLRDFANWIYRQLEREYEYRMSAENVDESIEINGYQFDENGQIH